MHQLRALARGLAHRGGSTVLILVVALVAVAAVAAGPAAVLRSVPEFTTSPSAPSLSYVPPAGPLAIALGAAVGLLIIASVATGVTLIRGVRLDQLREAPA